MTLPPIDPAAIDTLLRTARGFLESNKRGMFTVSDDDICALLIRSETRSARAIADGLAHLVLKLTGSPEPKMDAQGRVPVEPDPPRSNPSQN